MTQIEKFTTSNIELSQIAFDIRRKVFVDEQKVDYREEFDAYEDESQHYLIFNKGKAVGTARWRETSKGIKLERFAFLGECRGRGFGTSLLLQVLEDVKPKNKTLYLHAQLTAVGLYEKGGFKKVGEIFSECDIDHYLMEIHPQEFNNQTVQLSK